MEELAAIKNRDLWARSSAGQSHRLITGRSQVRPLAGPCECKGNVPLAHSPFFIWEQPNEGQGTS